VLLRFSVAMFSERAAGFTSVKPPRILLPDEQAPKTVIDASVIQMIDRVCGMPVPLNAMLNRYPNGQSGASVELSGNFFQPKQQVPWVLRV